jgi:hypothetical protein
MGGDGHFRAFGRHPTRLAAGLGGAEGLWKRPALVVDLSLGGARVQTDAEVPAGTMVRLSVESPSRWDPLEIGARVAWAHPGDGGGELGLAFEPSPALMRGLVDLLSVDHFE